MIFLDTGYFVGLFDDNDVHHDDSLKIKEFLEDYCFTEEDLDASKKSLEDAFRSVSDSPEGVDSWVTTQLEHSEYLYPEDYINMFKGVTKEDVIRAANDVTLDTVFMLEGTEDEEGEDE